MRIDVTPTVNADNFDFGKGAVVEDNDDGTGEADATSIPSSVLTNNKPEQVQLVDLEALVDTGLTRAATGSYLPRRRVSANRDFPPFCRRNAPRPEKDECPSMNLSVGNKSMGKQNLAVQDEPLRIVASNSINEVEKNVQDGNACKGRQVGIILIDSEGNDTEEVKRQDEFESSSRKKLPLDNASEKCVTIPDESNHYQVELNSKTVAEEEKGDAIEFEGNSGKEIIVYQGVQCLGTKSSDVSDRQRGFKRDFNEQQVALDRMAVLALMSESKCPWRHGRGSSKHNLTGGKNESKEKKVTRKGVETSGKFKIRESLYIDDISFGKERIKICANTIDGENPSPFQYTTSMIYPNWCNPIPPEGCNCTNGCSDSEKCSCAVKNGGEIPFNHNGAIIEAKPLVYECGPNCRCPSTCYNRVSQHGIKFQLEIFKTKTRGWGVISLNSIPSGSFICEYIGELLDEREAEQRTGNDEYLFDIGNNNSSNTLLDGLPTLTPDAQSSSSELVGYGGFTIDAAQYGNVGRFINHSCSPNLYAQNVLYDHDDKRIPHIMLFAAENIPPLQELTYDYNYIIDQVCDSDGNVKKKDCYCGSVECTGRMY